jgi:proton-translocating NADH-quinone oxidoreductase chain N
MDVQIAFTWMILIPMLSAPVIYIVGRLVARQETEKMVVNPARWLALASLLATSVMLYFTATGMFAQQQFIYQEIGGSVEASIAGVYLQFDGVSFLLATLVLVLGTMVTIFSFTYMHGEEGEEKFYALLVAMIGSIIGLGCAMDLFNLWVWFEVMAVTSILLVAFYRNQQGALEAGVKYLVQSAVGSVMVVIGIALIYMVAGDLNLIRLLSSVQLHPVLLIGMALLIIGFGVKIALVPLHTWLPDAHSQAPSGISAMLSGVVIEAGLIALLRVSGSLAVIGPKVGYILLGFAVLNMLVGNLMALRQTEVKRMLAYSSLSHIGYMLLGFGALFAFQSVAGGIGAAYHMLAHGLMKGLAFLAAGALLFNLKISKGNHEPLRVEDLNGASKKYPLTAFAFSVALLSLGGLPPLVGFMSKWQVFVAGVYTQNIWMIVLVVFAGLNSVLSLAYYAPLVNRMYRKQSSDLVIAGQPVSLWTYLPIMLLTLMVVVLGIAPSLISSLTDVAGFSLAIFLQN